MPVLLLSVGRSRWTPFFVAVAALMSVLGLWQWQRQITREDRTKTELDLVMIGGSLQSLSADSAAAIPQGLVTNLDARILYGLLSATNAGAFLLAHRNEWDQRHELVDPWGRPFHVQLFYPAPNRDSGGTTTVVRVKIWSVGPNGEDEQGAGDDITGQTVALRLQK